MSDTPDFRELVGDDLTPEEAARLRRVHDLLVDAGPPPELPPHLHEPVDLEKRDNVSYLPRRRVGLLLGIAAAIALTAFLGGFISGQRHAAPFDEVASLPMHSTIGTSNASAVIHVGKFDSAGNWPLKIDLKNLPALPKGQYYEMFLSRGSNAKAASCGTFRAAAGSDEVRLNAPYNLRRFNGWVVTREGPGSKHPVVLATA
ncbi:MAG: anti-sigma factor [Gaiellaceae bacterium]